MQKEKKIKSISYAKWGYIFILPFFLTYFIFSLIPLFDTIRNSFYEYYTSGLKVIGPKWVGFQNYISLLSADLPKYAWNTFVMWVLGFVPQIVIALLLASWFTNNRMKIRGKQFFKVVIYLPNLIMASAFAMLFFALFSNAGPVNGILKGLGIISEPIRFMESTLGSRTLVALMNFLMWFGNTTIMLMAAIMGINPSVFEAAELDGCTNSQKFFRITLPQIKPLLTYTLITSLIGGLQMFDVPQILTNGQGAPDRTTMTLIMFLNNHLKSKNYGMAGALSMYLFVISGILCYFVFRINMDKDPDGSRSAARKARRLAKKGGQA
jgi:cellobiose transport system permease protein